MPRLRRAYVDRGCRGHGVKRDGLEVVLSHARGVASPVIRREMRRRNAIEPVPGHMKSDGPLARNHLPRPKGGAVNAILCAVGHNCRLSLARFRRLLARLIASLAFGAGQLLPAFVGQHIRIRAGRPAAA